MAWLGVVWGDPGEEIGNPLNGRAGAHTVQEDENLRDSCVAVVVAKQSNSPVATSAANAPALLLICTNYSI